jgi:hypothetical protein
MQYLITIRNIEAGQVIGVEQAGALKAADIKVISNAGQPAEGITNVMDLFTSKGGQAFGAALEGFVNTPTGKKISDKILGAEEEKSNVVPVTEVIKTLKRAAGQSQGPVPEGSTVIAETPVEVDPKIMEGSEVSAFVTGLDPSSWAQIDSSSKVRRPRK